MKDAQDILENDFEQGGLVRIVPRDLQLRAQFEMSSQREYCFPEDVPEGWISLKE